MKKNKPTRGRQPYWNEQDEFFGPKHPLKAKYRELNTEATKLFIKQREDTLFFDKFSRKDVACGREERFNEELIALYRRS